MMPTKEEVVKAYKKIKLPPSPEPSSESVSKSMKSNRPTNTSPEIVLRSALWRKGIRGYRKNNRKIAGSPDIAFRGKKLAIFVHGCFWHSCPSCKSKIPKAHSNYWSPKLEKNRLRDMKNELILKEEGWKVFVAWECQIKKDLDGIIQSIESLFS